MEFGVKKNRDLATNFTNFRENSWNSRQKNSMFSVWLFPWRKPLLLRRNQDIARIVKTADDGEILGASDDINQALHVDGHRSVDDRIP